MVYWEASRICMGLSWFSECLCRIWNNRWFLLFRPCRCLYDPFSRIQNSWVDIYVLLFIIMWIYPSIYNGGTSITLFNWHDCRSNVCSLSIHDDWALHLSSWLVCLQHPLRKTNGHMQCRVQKWKPIRAIKFLKPTSRRHR